MTRTVLKDLDEQEKLARRLNRDVKVENDDDLFNLLSSQKGGAFRKMPIDMIITRDWVGPGLSGINTGVMLMRNSNWTKAFLRDLWRVYPEQAAPFNDQGSFRYLLTHHSQHPQENEKREERVRHVYLMEDNVMNAYPFESIEWEDQLGYSFDERRGWIVHFAGCKHNHQCVDWMYYYYTRAACDNFVKEEDGNWLFLYDEKELHRKREISLSSSLSSSTASSNSTFLNHDPRDASRHFSSPDYLFPPGYEYSPEVDQLVGQKGQDDDYYEDSELESRRFILNRLLPPFDEEKFRRAGSYTPVPEHFEKRTTKTVHPRVLKDQERRMKMIEKLDRENRALFEKRG